MKNLDTNHNLNDDVHNASQHETLDDVQHSSVEGNSQHVSPQTFEFTLFNSLTDTTGTRVAWTWEEIKENCSTYTERPDKAGELFSATIYRQGEIQRNGDDVEAVSALVFDSDENLWLNELDAIIALLGVKAIVFPTHSHGKADTKNHPNAHAPGQRYRIVILTRHPIIKEKFGETWSRGNQLLGNKLDVSCRDIAHAYYLPSHPNVKGLVLKIYEGELLNPDDLPELAFAEIEAEAEANAEEDSKTKDSKPNRGFLRAGDDFNATATNETSAEILERHGWKVERTASRLWKATRPGKDGPGCSATIGLYGAGNLYVFSTNAAPFQSKKLFKPYQILALLDFSGDWKAAAKTLRTRGFGAKIISNEGEQAPLFEDLQIDEREIPAPAMTGDGGAAEYSTTQILKILNRNWDCLSLFSNTAHAHRIAEYFGVDLRYSSKLGWVFYEDCCWNLDDKKHSRTLFKITGISHYMQAEAKVLYTLAAKLAGQGRAQDAAAMGRMAGKIANSASIPERLKYTKEALTFAAGIPRLRTAPDLFDQKPNLIAFKNGVWDKGEWREHRREDYILNLSPIVIDLAADQSEWLGVLNCMTGQDVEYQRTLQDIAGYILSGTSNLRTIPWLYGPKGTGKSTFAELFQTLLGKLAATIDPKKLSASTARERLGPDIWNKKLAVCAEAGSQQIESELLKTLSGADTFPVRFLFYEAFDAKPTHVLMMVSNDAPDLNAYDEALKDRIVALPFIYALDGGGKINLTGGARIETVRKDPQSPLVQGFAAWALEGLARVYREQKIHRAPCVEKATRKFWADTDQLTPFWETIDEDELREGIASSFLSAELMGWCREEGIKPISGKNFGKACRSRGLEPGWRGSGKNRERIWIQQQKRAQDITASEGAVGCPSLPDRKSISSKIVEWNCESDGPHSNHSQVTLEDFGIQ